MSKKIMTYNLKEKKQKRKMINIQKIKKVIKIVIINLKQKQNLKQK